MNEIIIDPREVQIKNSHFSGDKCMKCITGHCPISKASIVEEDLNLPYWNEEYGCYIPENFCRSLAAKWLFTTSQESPFSSVDLRCDFVKGKILSREANHRFCVLQHLGIDRVKVRVDDCTNDLANRIKSIRKSRGMTQSELADRIGISSAAVSSWESGSSVPEVSKLRLLSLVLGVTSDEILGLDDTYEEGNQIRQIYSLLDDSDQVLIRDMINQLFNRSNEKHNKTDSKIGKRVCWLNSQSIGYSKRKEEMDHLIMKKKEEPLLTSSAITQLLWTRGYSGLLCVLDIVMVFRGIKIPGDDLYEDLKKILDGENS